MRLGTWNVNSLRVRLAHLLDNGVAILSRTEIADVAHGIPNFPDDPKRCIAGTTYGIRVVCLYAPNGEAPGTGKYAYKLRWYEALARWMEQELPSRSQLALLGDMNVAPEDRDVHDPRRWEGKIHVSEPERAALRHVMDAGLADAFRLFPQPEKQFTWWDYRLRAFERGWGLRIDLALLSSDHAPVVVDIS